MFLCFRIFARCCSSLMLLALGCAFTSVSSPFATFLLNSLCLSRISFFPAGVNALPVVLAAHSALGPGYLHMVWSELVSQYSLLDAAGAPPSPPPPGGLAVVASILSAPHSLNIPPPAWKQ